MDRYEFGAGIAARRKALGLTQAELAARAGISPTNFISLIEQGKSPVPIERAAALAEALGLDPVDLTLQAMATRKSLRGAAALLSDAVKKNCPCSGHPMPSRPAPDPQATSPDAAQEDDNGRPGAGPDDVRR